MPTILSKSIFVCLCVQALVLGSRFACAEAAANGAHQNRGLAIDDLPHEPLPEGFIGWCGLGGRFLVTKGNTLQVHEPSNEDAIALRSLTGFAQCDETGENLIVDDAEAAAITKVNIKDQTSTIIARYKYTGLLPRGGALDIFVSPNLKYAAFDPGSVQMEQAAQPDGIRLVPVDHSAGRYPNTMWKQDSSLLFNSVRPAGADQTRRRHVESIQIIDVRSGRDITGNLPPGTWYGNSGVFLRDGKELLLFLRPSQSDISEEPGAVFACKVAPMIKCRSIISDVDDVSFSEDGTMATLKEVYKDPKRRVDGDANILPIAFVLGFRSRDGRMIASQRFTRKGQQLGLRVRLTSAGDRAAVIWENWCTNAVCASGSIVTLRAPR